ncbi:MAG TPA: cysteine synthase A [Syntrophomonas sp.]|nr:cysteine synthase A [Syntrophomonas sp.]
MKVANNILELIGETPLLKLNRITGKEDAEVYVKLESFNPGGSIKDRPGLYMIEKAEQTGKIGPGSMILEATSGNTGIGLAMAAAIKGYPIVIVMPENMSEERKKLLRFYGAQLVLTPADKGMAGAVQTAVQMVESDARYYLIKQFENPYNAESHEVSTVQEILKQMEGRLDVLVCGVGSGGTITGIARVLKENIPGVQIVAVEPANSAILSGKSAGSHKIQGIGAGFIPPVLNINLIDRIMDIEDNAALDTCRELARKEALLVGISSGAAIFAALQLAQELGRDKRILTIAADGAEKYVSTELFD